MSHPAPVTSPERRRYWETRLMPIRLDAEPVMVQLEKRRSVVIVLSAVTSGVVSILLVLFAAFGRPDIGAGLALSFAVPIVSIAWLDFLSLQRRVRIYINEIEVYLAESVAPKSG